MIKINNIEYKEFETKISWGKFLVANSGHKRTGISPSITFLVDNIFIELEFTFSKEMFENTVLDIKTNKKSPQVILYFCQNAWGVKIFKND